MSDAPAVLQESNNTVVWLRPHDVIAKVGRWPESRSMLLREHAVAAFLSASGAPIAPPVPKAEPTVDVDTGYTVTLWQRMRADAGRAVSPIEIADSLRALHADLSRYGGDLPSFEASVDRAQSAMANTHIPALHVEDRHVLLEAFERSRGELKGKHYTPRALHGEPHRANLIATSGGIRWIDLEEVCTGPLEWDVTFLPAPAASRFDGIDPDLLSLLRALSSASVATWCWIRWDVPEMRPHARYHLEAVRDSLRGRLASP